MDELPPLVTLFETEMERLVPLPEELFRLYGRLQIPSTPAGSYIFANFVSSLDGVIALNEPGHESAGEISGFNAHDQMVMGMLRAMSDVVIAGASTLRSSPGHIWTPEFIYPALAEAYLALRATMGKPATPLNVIVTVQGLLDLSLPLFQSEQVPVLILTTAPGEKQLLRQGPPPSVEVIPIKASGRLTAAEILRTIAQRYPAEMILIEAGPRMLGEFLDERFLDELFLTLAPQLAGRDLSIYRPGLVEGKRFAPEVPLWGKLNSVKRGDSHLFLRYSFR